MPLESSSITRSVREGGGGGVGVLNITLPQKYKKSQKTLNVTATVDPIL